MAEQPGGRCLRFHWAVWRRQGNAASRGEGAGFIGRRGLGGGPPGPGYRRQLTGSHFVRHLQAARSRRGGERGLLSGSAAAAAPPTAADLAWETAPPRRLAAQRSAGGRRGPQAPSGRLAAGLPGFGPGGSRRDGPQDGQGQHRPHVRQESAGPGARHPQPQGGRGEPGAPARARIRTRTLAPTQSDTGPDPGSAPDSGPQPAPEAPLPARAPAVRGLGLRTPAPSPSLSLLPGVGGPPPPPRGWPGRDFTAPPAPPAVDLQS